jgi:hypothetical protein
VNDIIGTIYNSPSSGFLRVESWIIPTVQSVHILALSVLVASAVMLDLKLAGILARADSGAALVKRYQPSLWAALAVLLLSGFTLLWAEPERVLGNWTFWSKMALVLTAFALTFLLRRRLLVQQEGEAAPLMLDRALGWIALAIWAAALFLGRWIAYTY